MYCNTIINPKNPIRIIKAPTFGFRVYVKLALPVKGKLRDGEGFSG